ncbi:MAG TPA: NAD-dependent epimerase/dehydratase family protein [Candidatus Angelobacter sp.]|nr:NAD-dependent epimerase/dehydratase family protein [Candidatus Angelobacter sp.]
MKKHILVTGGAGFVGSHLVDALLAAGHSVRVLDNLTPQVHGEDVPDYLSPEAELVCGDMRDSDAVRDALEGIEVVFHLAAAVGVGQSMYEIAQYVGANTQGTAVLLQELLGRRSRVEKLVLASSMSVYGEGKYVCALCGETAPALRSLTQLKSKQWETLCRRCSRVLSPIPTDESKPLQSSSIYSLSKRSQEEMCLLFGRTYSLPVVALRYFNIYGPRQALSNPYTGVAANFAARLLNGCAPLVFEDGNQMRDFLSVDDAVAAALLAMERSAADGLALNAASGEPITIREVAEHLAQALGANVPPELTGKYRSGDVRHCFADISAARTLLGYAPQVQFAAGVEKLVQWLREQQPRDRAAEAVAQLSNFGLTT